MPMPSLSQSEKAIVTRKFSFIFFNVVSFSFVLSMILNLDILFDYFLTILFL